jgi:hypothetical protein
VTGPAGSLRAQPPPIGTWLSPFTFNFTLQGCAGNQAEKFYAIHACVIPVGLHRGKLLVWDASSALACSPIVNGQFTGDRDQRWAIVDPINPQAPGGVNQFFWTIPAAFAPPVFQQNPIVPNITHGAQGLFCASQCWLPDGKLLTVGGDDWLARFDGGYDEYTGSRLVCIYDPLTGTYGTWSTLTELFPSESFLEVPRWYPAAVIVFDPTQPFRAVKVVVLGGIEQFVPIPPPQDPPGNGVYMATDRAYLSHEAYDVVQTPQGNWTISKDLRPGGVLPPNYSSPGPVFGRFIGPMTASSVSMPDFQLGHSLFYYARAHYLSDTVFGGGFPGGLLWNGGMPVDATWVDHPANPNLWSPPHPPFQPAFMILEEPTGVLLPASLGSGGENRIALFGGQLGLDHDGPIIDKVHVLDAGSGSPFWSDTVIPPMQSASSPTPCCCRTGPCSSPAAARTHSMVKPAGKC